MTAYINNQESITSRIANALRAKSIDNFSIDKLLITETGTYNDIFIRPYTLDTTHENIERLGTAMMQVGHAISNIKATTLSTTVPGLVKQSHTPEAQAMIANGWNTKRFRFVMVVNVMIHGTTRLYVYQGFSEHNDTTMSGILDSNMVFTINSVSVAGRTIQPDGRAVDTVFDSYNVLASDIANLNLTYANNNAHVQTMRPEDVFKGTVSLLTTYSLPDSNVTMVDGSSTLTSRPLSSSRKNNKPTSFAANTITGFGIGQSQADIGSSPSDVYTHALNVVSEPSLGEDPLLSILPIIQNVSGMVSNHFTLGGLTSVDPSIVQRMVVSRSGKPVRKTLPSVVKSDITTANVTGNHEAGATEHWGNSSFTATMASVLSAAIPAMMSELLVTKISFTVSPGTMETGPVFTAFDVKSILNLDVQQLAVQFRDRFLLETYRDLTRNGLIPITLLVNADLFNETWISISVNGEPEVVYAVPSFADANFAPVITVNPATRDTLIQDFATVFDHVDRHAAI